MRKHLLILSMILCTLLCGCGANERTAEIEFYTLEGDAWLAVSSSSETTAAPDTAVTAAGTTSSETILPDDSTELPDHTPSLTSIDAHDVCTYILNTNTKKFHDPACKSAARIKESNRSEFTGERSDILAHGYEPCKICNP